MAIKPNAAPAIVVIMALANLLLDTGYPGLLIDHTTLDTTSPAFFITWYSHHDATADEKNQADIYVAREAVGRG